MHWSLSYQQMDPWLYGALMHGVLSVSEANEMFDLSYQQTGDVLTVPERLAPAVRRLHLWALPAWGTVQ